MTSEADCNYVLSIQDKEKSATTYYSLSNGTNFLPRNTAVSFFRQAYNISQKTATDICALPTNGMSTTMSVVEFEVAYTILMCMKKYHVLLPQRLPNVLAAMLRQSVGSTSTVTRRDPATKFPASSMRKQSPVYPQQVVSWENLRNKAMDYEAPIKQEPQYGLDSRPTDKPDRVIKVEAVDSEEYAVKAVFSLLKQEEGPIKNDESVKKEECVKEESEYEAGDNLRNHFRRRKQYPCKECGKVFRTIHFRELHREEIHVQATLTDLKKEEEVQLPATREVKCNSGGSLRNIKTHEGTHTEVKPFSCNICIKTFSRAGHLETHKRIHTGLRPYSCDICDKTFTDPSHLKRHKFIHTGVKPYSCDICDKTFAFASNLKVHKRRHTGVRPYSCDMCDKAFADASSLKEHKRIHAGVRPYSCDMCDKTFTYASSLEVHERRHTGIRPYSCDMCDKAFAASSDLKVHERRHTGVRPYSCDMCDKAFAAASQLKVHKHRHTGVRPYSCDMCDKAFSQAGSLERHKHIHSRV